MIDFNGKLFIFDIFIREDKIYLVSTYYTQFDPAVCVFVNGVQLSEFGRNQYEPVRYFSGTAPSDPHITVRIEAKPIETLAARPVRIRHNTYRRGAWAYRGVSSSATTVSSPTIEPVEKNITAEYVDSTRGKMAVATLFMNDYKRIPTYCSYYRTQGVEKFFLYFNGPTLPDDIYKADDIEYRCWNYPYWNAGAQPINQPGVVKWAHNAQMTFLTAMCLRNLPRYDWFGLVDLDEIVIHPTKSLLEHLQSDISTNVYSVTSCCHWGERLDKYNIRYTHVGIPSNYGRTKVFYRSSYNNLCGIHLPKKTDTNIISAQLILIHYVDEYDPDSSSRTERLEAICDPTSILVLPEHP